MKRLEIGTILKDKKNKYIVLDSESKNTHSQYPSAYLIECKSGPNKGRTSWVSASLAIAYEMGN